jgi:hypothetical protein
MKDENEAERNERTKLCRSKESANEEIMGYIREAQSKDIEQESKST